MKRNEKSKVPLSRMLGFLSDNRADESIKDSESSGYYEGDFVKKDDTLSIRGSIKHKDVSLRRNRNDSNNDGNES